SKHLANLCPAIRIEGDDAMSADQNMQLVRRYFDEVWNKGNLEILDELAPELVSKGFKEFVRSQRTALGNFQATILDLFADQDRVALHWQVNAIHQSDYLGVAATGKSVTFRGISMFRIAEGKIVDDFGYWDDLPVLKQIGATSIPQ
ncbi:MAG TPA: ester cyclase, partial [Caldilineaceae bacterium]|nr:ester cyclase [Caldilineaceae bacterium]